MNSEKEINRVSEKSANGPLVKLISILIASYIIIMLQCMTPILWIAITAITILALCKLLIKFSSMKLFTGSVIIILIVPTWNEPAVKQNVSLVSQFAEQTYRQPQTATWRLLGEKVISFNVETDYIKVTRTEIFRKLKIKVMDAPMQLGEMKIVFANGAMQNIPLRFRVEEGRESKVIDLIGISVSIEAVYFSYSPGQPGFKGKGKIILLGQK